MNVKKQISIMPPGEDEYISEQGHWLGHQDFLPESIIKKRAILHSFPATAFQPYFPTNEQELRQCSQ